MKRSKFTEEQIEYALRQVESGTPPANVCRQLTGAAGLTNSFVTSSWSLQRFLSDMSVSGSTAAACHDGKEVVRRYRTTNVWLRRNGTWQVVAAHTGTVGWQPRWR